MFNGMFNDGCGEGKSGVLGGCNGLWLLIILFLLSGSGKLRNFSLNVNTCSVLLMLALLVSCGGISLK